MKDRKMVFGYELLPFSEYGLSIPIRLEIGSYPHMLITGASGSGKSMTLLFLLGKLLQCYPDIEMYLCDFKNSDDFSFLEGYPYYYTGADCYTGVMEYYEKFSEIRADREKQNQKRYVLIFDEYPAFINFLNMRDKANKTKLANDILGAVSEILMLGRGISCGIWLLTQRADSTLFSNGARDNLMVIIGLGRMSKEQKGMIFPGQEILDLIFSAGEGMLLADGREITSVKYPIIQDISDWKRHIRSILQKTDNSPI